MEVDKVSVPSSFLNTLDFPAYSQDGHLPSSNLQIDTDKVTELVAVATQSVRVTDTDKAGSSPYEELGRVSLINQWGLCVYDRLVKPDPGVGIVETLPYQTGITREAILEKGTPIETVVGQVEALIEGRRLVGHSVHDDLSILRMWGLEDLEDVQRIYRDRYPKDYPQLPGPSLEILANKFLNGLTFPPPTSTILRAQACLRLYLNHVQGAELEAWRPSGVCTLPKGKKARPSRVSPPPPPRPIELPCGHTTTTLDKNVKCPVVLNKECPRGHVNQVPCHLLPSSVQCQVEIPLGSCVHKKMTKAKCHEVSSQHNCPCKELVQVKCASGLHNQLVECGGGKTNPRCDSCWIISLFPPILPPAGHIIIPKLPETAKSPKQTCLSGNGTKTPLKTSSQQNLRNQEGSKALDMHSSLQLPCGHTPNNATKPEEVKCTVTVKRTCPSCGRQNRGPCHLSSSSLKCTWTIPITCPKGIHTRTVACFKKTSYAAQVCWPCKTITLPCGHTLINVSNGKLKAPLGILCNSLVEMACPSCGHLNKFPCGTQDPTKLTFFCQGCGHASAVPSIHKNSGGGTLTSPG